MDPLVAEVHAGLKGFRDQACACKDIPCADKVHNDMGAGSSRRASASSPSTKVDAGADRRGQELVAEPTNARAPSSVIRGSPPIVAIGGLTIAGCSGASPPANPGAGRRRRRPPDLPIRRWPRS
jgi:hypothetical protein